MDLIDLIRQFFWLPPRQRVKSFWDSVAELPPGEISVVTDKRNGNQYALMHLDDFDHLIGTGNKFQRRNTVPTSPSEKP